MINNCGTMGKLSVLPCLISHNHLKFLKHEAINLKAKIKSIAIARDFSIAKK